MKEDVKDYAEASARRAVLRALGTDELPADRIVLLARDGEGGVLTPDRVQLALGQLVDGGKVARGFDGDLEVYWSTRA